MGVKDVGDILKGIPESDETGDVGKEYDSIEEQLKKEKLREAQLKNTALEGENEDESQNRGQRKAFAERIFSFMCYYMFAVFFILFICGSPSRFNLSDTVLVTLLGTTTANVIGIFIIVVTYLFSRKKKSN